MAEVTNNKSKEVAKRYPYLRAASCELNGEIREIQILNISASGIKFAIGAKIETKTTIKIKWRDAKFGTFSPSFLIAREDYNPESREFPFFYGSQYFDLSPDVRQNLLHLLKNLVEEGKKEKNEQLQTITLRYLFEIIDEGIPFLHKIFRGEKISAYFDGITKGIKDYEREAFDSENDLSVLLKKIVMQSFHCHVLRKAAALMAENGDQASDLLIRFNVMRQEIAKIENNVEEFGRQLTANKTLGDLEKKITQKKLNESSNRLFQAKHGSMKALVNTFDGVNLRSIKLCEVFKSIKDEYSQIKNVQQPGFQEETQSYKYHTKKVNAAPTIIVPVMTNKKPNYTIWLGSFIALVVVCIYGLMKLEDKKDIALLEKQLDIPVSVLDFGRDSSQINIKISGQDWGKLPPDQKDELGKKVIRFLQKDRQAQGCIISDEKNTNLKILTEEDLPSNQG